MLFSLYDNDFIKDSVRQDVFSITRLWPDLFPDYGHKVVYMHKSLSYTYGLKCYVVDEVVQKLNLSL